MNSDPYACRVNVLTHWAIYLVPALFSFGYKSFQLIIQIYKSLIICQNLSSLIEQCPHILYSCSLHNYQETGMDKFLSLLRKCSVEWLGPVSSSPAEPSFKHEAKNSTIWNAANIFQSHLMNALSQASHQSQQNCQVFILDISWSF